MDILKLVKSDFFKMKHTSYYLIHLVIPILGSVLFLSYYSFLPRDPKGEIQYFLENLSLSFPILIGIITSSVIKQEYLAGNYKEMISTGFGRTKTLMSKFIMLLSSGILSLTLAMSCFVIGSKFILKEDTMDIKFYLGEILIIFTCVVFSYIFHVLISMEFGSAASIGLGIFETLIAEIMTTSLGEGLWQFTPCAWAANGSLGYMKSIMDGKDLYEIVPNFNIFIVNVILFTIIIAVFTFVRFKFFKGKIEN